MERRGDVELIYNQTMMGPEDLMEPIPAFTTKTTTHRVTDCVRRFYFPFLFCFLEFNLGPFLVIEIVYVVLI